MSNSTKNILVILPGLDGLGTQHEDFIAAVGPVFADVQSIVYPADQKLGYAELEALVRQQLPEEQPFVLLGESFSGPLAIMLAANPPPNLVGVVLVATFAKAPMAMLSPFAELTRFVPVRNMPRQVLSRILYGRWATDALVEDLHVALMGIDPDVLRFRGSEAMRVDTTRQLEQIRVPCLFLRAARERLIFASASEHIVSVRPDCIMQDIEGPHMLLQVAAADCARAIESFVGGLDNSSSMS